MSAAWSAAACKIQHKTDIVLWLSKYAAAIRALANPYVHTSRETNSRTKSHKNKIGANVPLGISKDQFKVTER